MLGIVLIVSMMLSILINSYIYFVFKKDQLLNTIYPIQMQDIRCNKLNVSRRFKNELIILNFILCIVSLGLYIKYGLTFLFMKSLFLTSVLLVIGFIDLKTKYIYTQSIVIGVVGVLFFDLLQMVKLVDFSFNPIFAALMCYGFIAIIIKLTNGMGEGDAQLAGLCGLALGITGGVMTLILSTLLGGLCGFILIIYKKLSQQDEIPFGPFIASGAILTMLFESELLTWYLGFFS